MSTLAEQMMDRINIAALEQQLQFLTEALHDLLTDFVNCKKLQNLVEERRYDDVFVALESAQIEVPYKDTSALEMTFSTEGIVGDIGDGIKKIFKAIWEGIKKIYRFIFRIEKDLEFISAVDDAWLDKIKDNKYKLPSRSDHEKHMKGFEDLYKLINDQVEKSAASATASTGKLFVVEVTGRDKEGKPATVSVGWSSIAERLLKEVNIKPTDEDAFFERKTDIGLKGRIFSRVGSGGIEPLSFDDYEEKTLRDLGYNSRDTIKKTLEAMEGLSKKYASLGDKKLDAMFSKALKEVDVSDNPHLIHMMISQTSEIMKTLTAHYARYHNSFYNKFKSIFKDTDVDKDTEKK